MLTVERGVSVDVVSTIPNAIEGGKITGANVKVAVAVDRAVDSHRVARLQL